MLNRIKGFILGLCIFCMSTQVLASTRIDVDFSKPSTEPRLTIIRDGQPIYTTYVSHGSGSGDIIPNYFSNEPGSHASSLGKYKVLNTYVGQHGLSIKLQGLDKTNSKAYSRTIVIHQANYVPGGRSWGCFAVTPEAMKFILANVKQGDILYAHI